MSSDDNILEFDNSDFVPLDLLLKVSDFLTENKEELVRDFQEPAKAFLANSGQFNGYFRVAFDNAFDAFITSLLRDEVVEHFSDLTPEQILLLTEPSIIEMATEGYFYDQDLYGNTNKVSQNS